MTYNTSPDGVAIWQDGVEQGRKVLEAAGAKEVWNGPKVGQHIMGGTIMGERRDSSVTNGWCQAHDVANLFIGGPGVFPTTSCANPTFTLHAVAMRSAEYLVENFGSI